MNQQFDDPDSHSLPSRRERLRALMTLKSQRRWLLAGVAALGAVSVLLGAASLDDSGQTETVKLGVGLASVEAQPVADLEAATSGAQPAIAPEPTPSESPMGEGHASYYGAELAGNRTASGETFRPEGLTAAHRTLPLGSKVRVTNPRNGQSVVVRINDRGPFHGNRVIDLSTAAARTIGLIRSGTGRVSMALLVN